MTLSRPALAYLLDLGRSIRRAAGQEHAQAWVQTLKRGMEREDPVKGYFIAELDGEAVLETPQAPRVVTRQYKQGGLL